MESRKDSDIPIERNGENVDVKEQKIDCGTFGQSLIKFMNLATGSVKTALQKPANYKKNINHRRYLQKQLRICPRRKRRSTTSKAKVKKGGKSEATMVATAELTWYANTNYEAIQMVESGAMQEFPSPHQGAFFPTYEPPINVFSTAEDNFTNVSNTFNIPNAQNSLSWNNCMIFEQQPIVSRPQTCNNSVFCTDDFLPDLLPEGAEQFLTGEELTQELDIKDLFVPERAELEINEGPKYPCNVDEIMLNSFQTVPSTTSILSW